MSTLGLPNGDDHPEAALKHLVDAQSLLDRNRADGAAYLSGYVVECALKSLWLLEKGTANTKPWGRRGHDLNHLAVQAAAFTAIAGAKTSRYCQQQTRGVPASSLSHWTPELRYRASHIPLQRAQEWYQLAESLYKETVGRMRIDGVI